MDLITLPKPLASRARNPGDEPTLAVLHATAGSTWSGAEATLRKATLSYHYGIMDGREVDGRIIKAVPIGRQAFHAGSSYGPREKARGLSRAQYPNTAENRARGRVGYFVAGCSVNAYSVGVSLVNANNGTDPYSAKQVRAVEDLLAELKRHAGIILVTTHAIVSPGRKTDPRAFPLEQVATRVGMKVWRP